MSGANGHGKEPPAGIGKIVMPSPADAPSEKPKPRGGRYCGECGLAMPCNHRDPTIARSKKP